MTSIAASAPGKAILLGEHAVVYGRPAIAIPLNQVRAKVFVTANPAGQQDEILFDAPDINLLANSHTLPEDHPFQEIKNHIKKYYKIDHLPAMKIRIKSSIPFASGLGSGTAVSVAMIRGISIFLGHPLPDEIVSQMAYEIEKIYHGLPSGIDNTVIAYEKPVYFVKDKAIETIEVKSPFLILVADSGIKSNTADVVRHVRDEWIKNQSQYDMLFDKIALLCEESRTCIASGNLKQLGHLFSENHKSLQRLGVSHPQIDDLVDLAISSGALGAKMSGAGWGGNIICLVNPENAVEVETNLLKNSAVKTILTTVEATQ